MSTVSGCEQVALDHLTATKQLREFSFKRCRQLRIMALVARYLPATERLERLVLTGSAIQVIVSVLAALEYCSR